MTNKSILSITLHDLYGSVGFQLVSYYHNQNGRMNHLPVFRVRSWNNGMYALYVFLCAKELVYVYVQIMIIFQLITVYSHTQG